MCRMKPFHRASDRRRVTYGDDERKRRQEGDKSGDLQLPEDSPITTLGESDRETE